MKNPSLTLLLLVSSVFLAQAQQTWQNYNTENSPLLSNQVSSILVDHDNNLWGAYAGAGGTGLGVFKYDGSTWSHYDTSNSGLPNNDIRSIAVDLDGNVWFACYNAGIVKFDGTTWTPYNVSNSGIAGDDVVTIKFSVNNRLWVGCYFSGISQFDGTTWTTYNSSNSPFPENNCINTLTITRDEVVWIGLGCQGGLARYSPIFETWTSYTQANSEIADHTVTSVFEDVSGKIWLTYLNNYVSSFDGTTWTHYDPPKGIYGIASDENGELWGSGNGLFKLEGSSWNEVEVDPSSDNYSFPSQSLVVDGNGRIWWSVQMKGLWTNSDPMVSTFEPTTDSFIPVYSGKIEWADLDSDLDLDLMYCGFYEGSPLTMVYENTEGSFTAKETGLPNIRNGSFATGDYDKDGDLDVLVSGLSTANISELYTNNGDFSFSLAYSFPGLINATMSWVDMDNDTDLDFMLAGYDEAEDPNIAKVYVYENAGGAFNLLPETNLPPCTQCSMDWADMNGDDYQDLLISGFGENWSIATSVYLNNGDKTFTRDENSVLKTLFNGDVQWGDFDNDEDMDALISGFSQEGLAYSLVYENNGGVLEERTDIQIMTTAENWFGGTAWADFNNDGYLDILVTGRGISQIVISHGFKIFLNDGNGQFAEYTEADFAGITESSVDCGDYDGDGDVDICYLGLTSTPVIVTGIYENKIIDNTAPAFNVSTSIRVAEDFETFTLQPVPTAVPGWEENQVVVYSIELIAEEKATAVIDPATGEISFTAIPNAFGVTEYKITADDGQSANNIFSTTILVNIDPINDAPELSAFEDMEIELPGTIEGIPFTIQDIDHPVSSLAVTVASSNNQLIDSEMISIVGEGTERTLHLELEEGALGETTITVTLSDPGVSTEKQFKITATDIITGLGQPVDATFDIFPNPTMSCVTVSMGSQMQGPYTIVVSDMTGCEVRRLTSSAENPVVDLSDLNGGLYLLKVINGNKITSPQKVIKAN